MTKRRLFLGSVGLLLFAAKLSMSQEIDSVVSLGDRTPRTVADQIDDPAERGAFVELYKQDSPANMLEKAKAFLRNYPQSAFLAQAYEIAARSSFDQTDYGGGLDYAKQSLMLLPENPLLLVSVADVQARQGLNASAIASARAAMEYLSRLGRPGSIPDRDWPDLKRKLEASADFAVGRALLLQALDEPAEERSALLRDSEAFLTHAHELNSQDLEVRLLRGLTRLSSGQLTQAGVDLAAVDRGGGTLAPKALENLRTIYRMLYPNQEIGFDSFVAQLKNQEEPTTRASPSPEKQHSPELSEYAGSESCKHCHASIYESWSQTGMAKMLRPYRPQNVIGDFENNNQFFLGDELKFRNGKWEFIRGQNRSAFARMELRDGRHYFVMKQSDGQWHSYRVDYTIGSKWQQAYATTLPNGRIHVFPLQFNALCKQWVNFWQAIDATGSTRADPRLWEKFDVSTSYPSNCAVCHTSQLRNVKGGGFEPDNLEFREAGVDCEMCHGPSLGHVVEERFFGNEPMKNDPGSPPVQFGKIGRQDFIRICAQCHMQSAVREPGPHGELNYARAGNFALQSLRIPFGEFSRKGFYKDGRFRQTTFIVESLERSQCFKKSLITCGSCHDPHGHDSASNPTSLRFRDEPNRMCTGCHVQFEDKSALTRHVRHSVASEGSWCVSCHMPRIAEALLFRARTHQIDDIPNAEMTLRFGQEESPNACLLCHTDKDAKWVQGKLLAWRAGQ